MELLLASGNAKKLAEVRGLLEPLGVRVLVPSEVGGLPEVVEDQPDFVGNARKKASAAALHTGRWCLADDSGLEVDALGGAPGVRSARYAGEPADDARNNAKLLVELADVPTTERGARFVCALALADPQGRIAEVVVGTARGRILEHARGTRDFGYDPLFLFTEEGHPETGRGFAELETAEKAAVSHRGRALRALLDLLPAHLGARH
jgi:XTP/dITP diphosphohydrolase